LSRDKLFSLFSECCCHPVVRHEVIHQDVVNNRLRFNFANNRLRLVVSNASDASKKVANAGCF